MKNFNSILLLLASIAVISSCKPKPPTPPDPPGPEILKSAFGLYNNNIEGEESPANFGLLLFSGTLNTAGEPVGAGHGMLLVLVSEVAADPSNAKLTAGTYTVSESGALHTIVPGNNDEMSHFFAIDATGENYSECSITSGSVTVAVSGNIYTITTNLVDKNGVELKYSYNGAINFVDVSQEEPDAVFTTYKAWYWGENEYQYPGIGDYQVLLIDGEDEYGELVGEGYELAFSIYDEMCDFPPEVTLPTGFFTASKTYAIKTFRIVNDPIKETLAANAYVKRIVKNETGELETLKYYVVGGSINVEKTGTQYEITFELLLDDDADPSTGEDVEFTAIYEGEINMYDHVTISSLKGDHTTSAFGSGAMDFMGVSKDYDQSLTWFLTLTENTIIMNDLGEVTSGIGDLYYIDLTTELTASTTELTPGEYIVRKTKEPFSAVEGTGILDFAIYYGAWYFRLDYDSEDVLAIAPIRSGKVTVAKDGDEYTIDFKFVDDARHNISGTYKGKLIYSDKSVEEDAVAPKFAPYAVKRDLSNVPAKITAVRQTKLVEGRR